MITCHQEIISNIAVVGWKPWIDSEQVRRATFRVSAFKAVLRHRQQHENRLLTQREALS